MAAFDVLSPIRVLFVDHDASMRFAYQSFGASEGIGVELAANGQEALQFARVLLPDVIVLNLRLPDMDGVEVARRLRASEQTRRIPIAILSADGADEAGAAAARTRGRESPLRAAFSPDALLRLIELLVLHAREAVEALGPSAGARPEVPAPPESHARLSPRCDRSRGRRNMNDDDANLEAVLPVAEGSSRRRGFAMLAPERVSELARRGGQAAHRAGTAHRFTSEEARVAGRKGGSAPRAKRSVTPRPEH
jgi:CheY-like chemotaxis protein/general stress protein YciG